MEPAPSVVNMSISEQMDPRDVRYITLVTRRAEGISEEDAASGLGFDSPEDLYRQLAWDGFPVCAWCGSGFVGEDHCEPAREHRRRETRALYSSGLLRWPLFSLVRRWMEELARVGVMPELRRQAGRLGGPPEEDARPVPLESGEVIYIRPSAIVDVKGYERAEVLDQLLRTDVAILAALAVLEGGEGPTTKKGDPDKEILYAVYDVRKAGRKEKDPAVAEANVLSRWEQLVKLTEAKLQRTSKTFKELDKKLDKDERKKVVERA